MRYYFKVFFSIIIIVLSPHCQTNNLTQIKKYITESTSIPFINKDEFDKSRALMLSKLDYQFVKNDTIIFIESFPDGTGSNYHSWIYGSKENTLECYKAIVSYKKGVSIDSLVSFSCSKSVILDMVRDGRLDEVKQKGSKSILSPASTLIINIGIKDEKSGKFDFMTLVTQEFSARQ